MKNISLEVMRNPIEIKESESSNLDSSMIKKSQFMNNLVSSIIMQFSSAPMMEVFYYLDSLVVEAREFFSEQSKGLISSFDNKINSLI